MNKTIFIGDIHGRSTWKEIIQAEQPDRVVFVGDYFDSFDIPGIDQLHNFKEILAYKRSADIEVILLIGNHDHHYLQVGETYSGYQPAMQWDFCAELRSAIGQTRWATSRDLQIAYQLDNLLVSHAGISSVWLDKHLPDTTPESFIDDLNDLYEFKPVTYNFAGHDPYGNSKESSPIWIRPGALMKANRNTWLKESFIQIYGHTANDKIDMVHFKKAAGEKYLCIDALEDGWYLVYQDQKLTPVKHETN